jgi:alcohol dehydrogenase class IV
MELKWSVPTRIILGDGCILNNAGLLAETGRRAFIVTSPSSAKNGSLDDLKRALDDQGVFYAVYDKTPPNPPLLAVGEMGSAARALGCDFVVGLGGGSAMDAAKAAAVLAANDTGPEGVYKQPYKNKPLPLIAVPTTCGTGSEVTAASVLTVGDMKKSFKSDDVIPKIAFLDARYIDSLPQSITVDTAVDALSHALEGYLIMDSWVSDMLAERVFAFFSMCLPSLVSGGYSHEIREHLLFMAMLAGLSIVITGTSAVHAMGYALTTQRDVPHGRACGLLLGDFLALCYPAKKAKIDKALSLLGIETALDFKKMLDDLFGEKEEYTLRELKEFTEISCDSALSRPNPVKMEKEDVFALFKKALL